MELSELIKKSPMRKFESSLRGGLKHGEVGVITAAKGAGKSSLLVQLGLDQLLKGKSLIHVSFNQELDHTFEWYNNMFNEIAKMNKLENAKELKETIFRKRVVLNFNQSVVRTEHILTTVRAFSSNVDSKPDLLLFDDFNFGNALPEALKILKAFTSELGITTWYSASSDVRTCSIAPELKPYIDDITVLLYLDVKDQYVPIKAIKEHDKNDVELGVGFDLSTMHLIEK